MNPIWISPHSLLARRTADFVSEAIYGKPGKFPRATVMGVFDRNRLVAGVLYYDYDEEAGVIQVSAASSTPRWLTRPVLWEMFDFPFNQLACQAVVMRVDPQNLRLKRILTSYGFEKYEVPRLRGRDKAETICILGDDVWRRNGFHKKKKNGKENHGKKAPDPTPPRQVIATQMGSNINTGIANAYLNNVTRYGPDGKIEIRETGQKRIHDPKMNKSYRVPTFSQYVTLSDAQKAIKKQQDDAKLHLATVGANQAKRMNALLEERIEPDGLPELGDMATPRKAVLTRIEGKPGLENLGDEDFSKERDRIEKTLLERMRPQQEMDLRRLESRLAAQGVRMGSEAYAHALAQHGKRVNDARTSAILAAGAERERMAKSAERRAILRNDVRQKAFENEMRKAEMNNALALEEFKADLARAGAQAERRKSVLEEKFALRNAPLNRIIALLSGSQVVMPRLLPVGARPVDPVNVAGVFANYDRNRIQAAKGNSGVGLRLLEKYLESDRRLKREIAPVGKTNDGQTVYRFRYKTGGPIRMGLMADEVARKHPEAVATVGGDRPC